jgi:SNF2 family DNA or RNA helicase
MTYTPKTIRPAPYQLVGLTKLVTNSFHGVLIADGVGVGKTISSAYAMVYLTSSIKKPGLVVCPPSLVLKWIEELKSKFGATALPIRSPEDLFTAKRESSQVHAKTVPIYVMASSVILRTRVREYPRFSLVIFDEIHNYRNSSTKSFAKAVQISSLAEYKVGLSATPINNSLDDLVSELKILIPTKDLDALQAAIEEIWRSDKMKLTSSLVTRFTKAKLRIHFARRRIITRSVAYAPSYSAMVAAAIYRIHSLRGTRSSLYEDITYFRLAASSPYSFAKSLKLSPWDVESDNKFSLLKEILSSEVASQWLIFCGFEDTVEYLRGHLGDWECFTMTGSTPVFERPPIIKSFRETDHSLLIMTEVGSEGLDLQFCNAIVNYDLHWNPMRLEQRIGRVDRIGQEKDEVTIYNVIVSGSIDERVIHVVKRKLGILEGSVFSPGKLFGKYEGTGNKRSQLFNDQTLSHELDESRALFGALEYTNELSTEDYSILPDINEKYCMPPKLIQAAYSLPARLPWLQDSPRTSTWIESVKRSSEEFDELLRYYS